MSNEIKDKVVSMVNEAIKARMDGAVLSWPNHSIPFIGKVAAGSSKIEIRDIGFGSNPIRIQVVQSDKVTRQFMVKVTEA